MEGNAGKTGRGCEKDMRVQTPKNLRNANSNTSRRGAHEEALVLLEHGRAVVAAPLLQLLPSLACLSRPFPCPLRRLRLSVACTRAPPFCPARPMPKDTHFHNHTSHGTAIKPIASLAVCPCFDAWALSLCSTRGATSPCLTWAVS